MFPSLAGKVALITGASSGIGAATAVLLAKQGARLVLSGRNEENLNKTLQSCQKQGKADIHTIVADVGNVSDAERLVNESVSKFGRLDCLVNNAGVIESGSIIDCSSEQFDRIFNINVKAPMLLSKLCVPHLEKTKGCIVNVSSVTGLRAFPGVLVYNMSKSALDQMTRCTALELAPKGIRVNSVNPGVTVTNLHKRGGQNDETYAKFLEHSKTTHPLGRVGEADEVANVIAFLASDLSSNMTGTTLPVDGGRHATCLR